MAESRRRSSLMMFRSWSYSYLLRLPLGISTTTSMTPDSMPKSCPFRAEWWCHALYGRHLATTRWGLLEQQRADLEGSHSIGRGPDGVLEEIGLG